MTSDPKKSSGVKKIYTIRKPICDFLFDFYGHHLSLTVFEIFDFKVFKVWPLTPKGHLGSKNLYHSRAHIWLPIWLLWTIFLYLVPFSRYSTSKFLGFDLDLWPQKVIWGQKNLYYSRAHIWFTIWLLWTPSLYLVPFSRYSTSKFLGFDLDLWPQKVIWGQKNLYYSKAHIWLPIWLLWTPSLYLTVFEIFDFKVFRVWPWPLTPKGHLGSKKFIPFESSYMTSYLTSMDNISLSRTVLEIFDFKVFRVWPWPLTPKDHLGSKIFIPFESPYMTSYLTSMDTISLSLTVFEIFDFKVFRVWPWPLTPKGHLGSKKLYHSKAHIWFTIWLLWTPSLYLVSFSRYSTSKFLGFDLDLWPLKIIWGRKNVYHSKAHIWLPIWLLWTPSLYLVPFLR